MNYEKLDREELIAELEHRDELLALWLKEYTPNVDWKDSRLMRCVRETGLVLGHIK